MLKCLGMREVIATPWGSQSDVVYDLQPKM